jgi:hypothetical protein
MNDRFNAFFFSTFEKEVVHSIGIALLSIVQHQKDERHNDALLHKFLSLSMSIYTY